MATLEQLERALINADRLAESGDLDAKNDAISLAREIKKMRGENVFDKKEEKYAPSGFMPFLNRELSGLYGAPVDITNFFLPYGNIPGGSEDVQKFFEERGIAAPADAEPETFTETMGEVAGEILSFAAPGGALSKAFKGAKGAVGAVAKPMYEAITKKPLQSLAVESAAVPFIAGARESELGPVGEMAAAAFPSVATAVSPTKIGLEALKGFLPSEAKKRAATRLQNLAGSPGKAAKRIDTKEGTGLSPAAMTEEPDLLALEQAVLGAATGPVRQNVSINRANLIDDLTNKILVSANKSGPRAVTKNRFERLSKSLDIKIEEAADNARQALDDLDTMGLDPMATKTEANKIVRTALEDSLTSARKQEAELWGAIPNEAKGSINNFTKAYNSIVKNLASAQKDDVPTVANVFLKGFDTKPSAQPTLLDQFGNPIPGVVKPKTKFTTIRELDGVYKKLGEEATLARANGQFNKARIAENLRASILKDLNGFNGGGAELKEARAFSKTLNEKFSRGAVGKVLGFAREGGEAVATELTIPSLIGSGKVKGRLNVQQLIEASDDPTALEGISDYLKADFRQNVINRETGRVDKSKYNSFLQRNEEILELVPSTKQQLSVAESLEDVQRRVIKKGQAFRKAFDKPSKSITSSLMDEDISKVVSRVMSSADPESQMQLLVNAVNRDKSGEALKGLKAALSEHLVNIGTRTDINGKPVIDGIQLRALLLDRSFNNTLSKVFDGKEMAGLTRNVKLIGDVQKLSSSKPLGAIIDDKPGYVIEKIAAILGAKAGAKLSGTAGGSIQSASIGSSAAQKFLNNLNADTAKALLIDAMEDPKLMQELLRFDLRKKTPARVLRNYMLSPVGSRLVDLEILQEAEREARTEGRK